MQSCQTSRPEFVAQFEEARGRVHGLAADSNHVQPGGAELDQRRPQRARRNRPATSGRAASRYAPRQNIGTPFTLIRSPPSARVGDDANETRRGPDQAIARRPRGSRRTAPGAPWVCGHHSCASGTATRPLSRAAVDGQLGPHVADHNRGSSRRCRRQFDRAARRRRRHRRVRLPAHDLESRRAVNVTGRHGPTGAGVLGQPIRRPSNVVRTQRRFCDGSRRTFHRGRARRRRPTTRRELGEPQHQ